MESKQKRPDYELNRAMRGASYVQSVEFTPHPDGHYQLVFHYSLQALGDAEAQPANSPDPVQSAVAIEDKLRSFKFLFENRFRSHGDFRESVRLHSTYSAGKTASVMFTVISPLSGKPVSKLIDQLCIHGGDPAAVFPFELKPGLIDRLQAKDDERLVGQAMAKKEALAVSVSKSIPTPKSGIYHLNASEKSEGWVRSLAHERVLKPNMPVTGTLDKSASRSALVLQYDVHKLQEYTLHGKQAQGVALNADSPEYAGWCAASLKLISETLLARLQPYDAPRLSKASANPPRIEALYEYEKDRAATVTITLPDDNYHVAEIAKLLEKQAGERSAVLLPGGVTQRFLKELDKGPITGGDNGDDRKKTNPYQSAQDAPMKALAAGMGGNRALSEGHAAMVAGARARPMASAVAAGSRER